MLLFVLFVYLIFVTVLDISLDGNIHTIPSIECEKYCDVIFSHHLTSLSSKLPLKLSVCELSNCMENLSYMSRGRVSCLILNHDNIKWIKADTEIQVLLSLAAEIRSITMVVMTPERKVSDLLRPLEVA